VLHRSRGSHLYSVEPSERFTGYEDLGYPNLEPRLSNAHLLSILPAPLSKRKAGTNKLTKGGRRGVRIAKPRLRARFASGQQFLPRVNAGVSLLCFYDARNPTPMPRFRHRSGGGMDQ